MKAIRIHAPAGPQGLVYEDIPAPEPREGEVLVRVYATGITPMELSWQTTRSPSCHYLTGPRV